MNMRSLADLNNSGGGGGGGAAGQGGEGGGCADCIKGIWAKTPFWTRSLFIASWVIYLLSWITSYVIIGLLCVP